MKRCFADTSYYLALVNPDDDAHDAASHFTSAYDGEIVTTAAVLTELGNHLHSPVNRPLFVRFCRQMSRDPAVRLIHVDATLFDAAISLYERRPDQHWSLTDCISFSLMDSLQLRDALTTDHHFAQAGYNALFLKNA